MVFKLTGGTVIQYVPPEHGHPNAESPFIRILLPGTIQSNTTAYALFCKVSQEQGGDPAPIRLDVQVRKTKEATYVVMAPGAEGKPGVLPFYFKPDESTPAPTVAGLRDTFRTAELELRPDVAYKVDMFQGIDDLLGPCIYGNWSKATPEPIETKKKKAQPAPASPPVVAQQAQPEVKSPGQ